MKEDKPNTEHIVNKNQQKQAWGTVERKMGGGGHKRRKTAQQEPDNQVVETQKGFAARGRTPKSSSTFERGSMERHAQNKAKVGHNVTANDPVVQIPPMSGGGGGGIIQGRTSIPGGL